MKGYNNFKKKSDSLIETIEDQLLELEKGIKDKNVKKDEEIEDENSSESDSR